MKIVFRPLRVVGENQKSRLWVKRLRGGEVPVHWYRCLTAQALRTPDAHPGLGLRIGNRIC